MKPRFDDYMSKAFWTHLEFVKHFMNLIMCLEIGQKILHVYSDKMPLVNSVKT